jgi:hypothetical protein
MMMVIGASSREEKHYGWVVGRHSSRVGVGHIISWLLATAIC